MRRVLHSLLEALRPLRYRAVRTDGDDHESMDPADVPARFRARLHDGFAFPSVRQLLVWCRRQRRRVLLERRALIAAVIVNPLLDALSHCVASSPTSPSTSPSTSPPSCNDRALREYMRNPDTPAAIITARWGVNGSDDADEYVDLPLSARHPTLSTAALHTIVPTAPTLAVAPPQPEENMLRDGVALLPLCSQTELASLPQTFE